MTMNRMKCFVLLIAMLFLGMLIPLTAFAEGGNGSGPSEGTAGSKPLAFVSVTLVDSGANVLNAKDIPLKPKFKLLFDKNVVTSTIWGINRECFTLISNDGGNVPIEVTKVDDSIDFSQRQAIFVEPSFPLKPGTTYNLKVKPELLAKNGVSTLGGTTSGLGVMIVFATKGEAAAKQNNAVAATQQVATPEPSAVTTQGQANQEQSSTAAGSQKATENQKAQAASDQGPAALAANGNTNPEPTSETPSNPSSNPSSPVTATSADTQSSKEAASGKSGEQALGSTSPAGEPAAVSETGTGDPHWRLMMLATAVLVAGWAALELLVFRRKRAKKRLDGVPKLTGESNN